MNSVHNLECTLNIKAPCRFVANKEENVRQELENRYNKICYNGCYIVSIDKILNMSQCRSINTSVDAICIINVCFRVITKTYVENDILPMVRICISQGKICGVGEDTLVTFINNTENNLLRKDQIVPICVGYKTQYGTGNKRINILGSLLSPIKTTNIYKIKGSLDLSHSRNKSLLDNYINDLDKQNSQLKTRNSQYFIELLNSYNTTKKSKGSINIFELIKDAINNPIDVTGYWSKDLHSDYDSFLYIKTPETLEPAIDITPRDGFIHMLRQCYGARKGVIQLGTHYNEALKKESENIWTYMKRNKLG